MKIGKRRHVAARMAEIEGAGLAFHRWPTARHARTQWIGRRIIGVIDRDHAASGGDLERTVQQIRPEGRVMPPHHVDGRAAPHANRLRNDEAVVLETEHALHLHRDGVESPRQAKLAGAGLPAPRRDRGLAMEAVEHAVNRAGIAAVRKEQRPAAGVARQPFDLVARREAGNGECHGIPGHSSEHGQSGRPMDDLRDGAPNLRQDGSPDRIILDVECCAKSGHLMAPAMRPRMKCFWKTM